MPSNSALFGLPGELRNRIYRLVLLVEGSIDVDSGCIPEPALLVVCQQLRREGIYIYYTENQF